MNVVVYSAVTGRRDEIRPSPYPMVLFSDAPGSAGNVEVRELSGGFTLSPAKASRWHSANSHLAVPDADVSVWVNGSQRLSVPPQRLVELLGDADMACHRHMRRDCAYEEGYEIARRGIDDPEVLRAQLARYREEGHPEHWGLWGLSVYVRRHTDKVRAFNEDWWEEILRGSYRDQVSFPVVARRHGLRIVDLPGDQDRNPLTTLVRHAPAPLLCQGADIRPRFPAPRIFAMTPFSPDKNLGAAYNEAMEMLPNDAWACFVDHDAMFTTASWHEQLSRAILAEPRGAFTAVTNRIASRWQVAQEAARIADDVRQHLDIGRRRIDNRNILDVTDTPGWGGVLMCLSKEAWRAAGGFADGLLCVDHQMHYALRAAGRRIYCVEGLYVYHTRLSSARPGADLPSAVDREGGGPCRCRSVWGKMPEPRNRRVV